MVAVLEGQTESVRKWLLRLWERLVRALREMAPAATAAPPAGGPYPAPAETDPGPAGGGLDGRAGRRAAPARAAGATGLPGGPVAGRPLRTLLRAGWTLYDVFASRWSDDPIRAALDLAARITRP